MNTIDIEKLSDELTISQASALLFRVLDKKSTLSKSKRFGLYPIKDWAAFERAKKLEASLWPASRVKFTTDIDDFNNLPDQLKKPLIMCFGFFAVGDGGISDLLAYRMILMSDSYEMQYYYVIQLNNERVHNETYGKMIYTLISSQSEREKIFDYVNSVRSIKKMSGFIENAIKECSSQTVLLLSLACAEYIMFTPLFCIIFWYKAYYRGKLPGIIFSNVEIAKDEGQHCLNACKLYRALGDKLSEADVHRFVDSFVEVVSEFGDDALENATNMQDLTPKNVRQYIKYVADDLLEKLGYKSSYHVSNPFEWMIYTNLVAKENFYETDVSQYKMLNVEEEVKEAYELCVGSPPTSENKDDYW